MTYRSSPKGAENARRWIRLIRRPSVQLAFAFLVVTGIVTLGSLFLTGPSQGGSGRALPLPIGATEGYGSASVLGFIYPQQFYCTDERLDDLDGPGHTGDGFVAAEDPDEFQHPAMGPPGSPCIVGATRPNAVGGSLPSIQPSGESIGNVEKIWAI